MSVSSSALTTRRDAAVVLSTMGQAISAIRARNSDDPHRLRADDNCTLSPSSPSMIRDRVYASLTASSMVDIPLVIMMIIFDYYHDAHTIEYGRLLIIRSRQDGSYNDWLGVMSCDASLPPRQPNPANDINMTPEERSWLKDPHGYRYIYGTVWYATLQSCHFLSV